MKTGLITTAFYYIYINLDPTSRQERGIRDLNFDDFVWRRSVPV